MDTRPVDLAAPDRQATDWKVTYGYLQQFKAYFDDRAKAEQFAANHAGRVEPLAPM